jgi:hypothetical protein
MKTVADFIHPLVIHARLADLDRPVAPSDGVSEERSSRDGTDRACCRASDQAATCAADQDEPRSI